VIAIRARVLGRIKFYALYFRDNIKREMSGISFLGLPIIFEWYSRGIGLPEKEALHDSRAWCFYNRRQAEKGYELLRRLIVDYEFDWPEGAMVWVYETRSVPEQLYHKMDSLHKAALAREATPVIPCILLLRICTTDQEEPPGNAFSTLVVLRLKVR
jgi:hypothetical protein